MANDVIEVDGIVADILGGGKYDVYVEDMDLHVEAYAAGKMKKFRIKIIPGDLVKVELNAYEPTKGRIVYRAINRTKQKKPEAKIVTLDSIVGNTGEDTSTETTKKAA